MRILKVSLWIVVVFLTACDKDDPSISNCEQSVLLSSDKYNNGPYDESTVLQKADWDGECLQLVLAYSGGCDEHLFEIVTDGSLIKTLPPILQMGINHNNVDECQSYIIEILTVDILSLDVVKDNRPIILKFKDNEDIAVRIE